MRLHSTSNIFSGREPWNYSGEVCSILKAFLRLRHRLVPYLYTMNFESARHGIMPLRPMYYLYPRAEEAYQVPNQYYFGSQLIVCPITSPVSAETGMGSVAAWLPEGTYYDFFTAQRYSGGGMKILHRPLSQIPVFAKAGAIVPLTGEQEAERFGVELPEAIDVNVFCGDSGEYTMYEDDGSDEHAALTRFEAKWSEDAMRFSIKPDEDSFRVRPAMRRYRVCFYGIKNSTVKSDVAYEKTYDTEKKVLTVTFGKNSGKIELQVLNAELADIDRSKRIFKLLQHCRIGYELKEKIYNCICAKKNPAAVIHELQSMALSHDLIGALAELGFE